jgi:hypothetical protein
MQAVIHEVDGHPGAGLLPIAGRPLVARQIQWLRSMGCQGIAVQIGTSAESVAVARWLSEKDAVGAGVRLVPAGSPLVPRAIARRAGMPPDRSLVVMPADVLAAGDLRSLLERADARSVSLKLSPPAALGRHLAGAEIQIVGEDAEAKRMDLDGACWGARVRSLAEAFALGVAAIDGRLAGRPDDAGKGILVHAAERAPGIWTGRDAVIEQGAVLVPPVLLGVGVVVRAGARVGPRVFLGDRAVVDQGTWIEDAIVAQGTIVGDGLELSGVALDESGLLDLRSGERTPVDDALVLAPRDQLLPPTLTARLVGLLLYGLVAPLRAAAGAFHRVREHLSGVKGQARPLAELCRALSATTRGERSLLGVSPWTAGRPAGVSEALYADALSAPLGLFAIDAALTPPDADPATQLRARAFYAHHKRAPLDLVLFARSLRSALRRALP